jgi:RNA exonuclease 1
LDEATTFASNSLSQIATSAGLVESSNGQPSAPKGCTTGPHVFKEEKVDLLHKREGFLSTEQVLSTLSKSDQQRTKYDVLAFDCELVYTTAGMSLARLTVLDEGGLVTLDQYVKPRASILDYNTR